MPSKYYKRKKSYFLIYICDYVCDIKVMYDKNSIIYFFIEHLTKSGDLKVQIFII